MAEQKRFDDWSSELICDECEHYFTGACDSLKSKCNEYKPTRRATLEKRLSKNEGLTQCLFVLVIVNVVLQFVRIFVKL